METNKCSKCGNKLPKENNNESNNLICASCTKKKRTKVAAISLVGIIGAGLLAFSLLKKDNTLKGFDGVNITDSTAINQRDLKIEEDSLAALSPETTFIGEAASNIESFKRELEAKKTIPSISILYNLNTYDLSTTNSTFLLYVIEQYKKSEKGNKLLVEGYTCDLGTDQTNDILSQKRSDNVKDFLVKHGVDEKDIEVKSYGKTKFASAGDLNKSRIEQRKVSINLVQ